MFDPGSGTRCAIRDTGAPGEGRYHWTVTVFDETGAAAERYTGELAEARSRAEGGARSRPFTDPVLVLPADRDPMPHTPGRSGRGWEGYPLDAAPPRLGRACHRQASLHPIHRRSTKCQPSDGELATATDTVAPGAECPLESAGPHPDRSPSRKRLPNRARRSGRTNGRPNSGRSIGASGRGRLDRLEAAWLAFARMATRLAGLHVGAFRDPGDPALISLPGPAWRDAR